MRPHVDAARRLIEDQELGFGQQPAGEQHLLLVAAGEKLNRLLGAGGANTQLANKAFGDLVLLPAGNGPQPAALGLQGEDDILPHRGGGNDAVGFAILRTEADPQARRLMRRA